MASISEYLEENNISGWLVILQFFIAVIPRFISSILGPRGRSGIDGSLVTKAPRSYIAKVLRLRGSYGPVTARIIRFAAILDTTLENLPLFAIAVLAANLGESSTWNVNVWAIWYILISLAVMGVYVYGPENTELPGEFYALVWVVSNVILGYMFLIPFQGQGPFTRIENINTSETGKYFVVDVLKTSKEDLDTIRKFLEAR